MNDVMSVEEAAELVKCKPATLLARLRTGALPGLKLGRSWIIPREPFVRRLGELAVKPVAVPEPTRGRRRPLLNLG